MAAHPNRTLVCSVLFADIVAYSKRGVGEQVRLKQAFNSILGAALDPVPAVERVVLDTGDGAAVTFLGDPEAALFVALALFDRMTDVPLRVGINLGPVSLMKDINGLDNVVGDGINVAQRVMSFAGEGRILVSRAFYEVMALLSPDYAALFSKEPSRTDKHQRAHDLYALADAVRVGRRVLETQAQLEPRRTAQPRATAFQAREAPAQLFDAGTHYIVSAGSEAAVQEAVRRLGEQGASLLSPVARVGNKWLASVGKPALAVPARVEELGFKRIISAPTREAVEAAVQDLLERGAVLVREAELADGLWTAVCEKT